MAAPRRRCLGAGGPAGHFHSARNHSVRLDHYETAHRRWKFGENQLLTRQKRRPNFNTHRVEFCILLQLFGRVAGTASSYAQVQENKPPRDCHYSMINRLIMTLKWDNFPSNNAARAICVHGCPVL